MAGVEPALLSELDFESRVSTSFTRPHFAADGGRAPSRCLFACVLAGAANDGATIAAKLAQTMATADGMVER